MMKYLIKIIAHIPAITVGISTVFCLLAIADYAWAYLLYVGNLFAFTYLFVETYNIEKFLNDLIKDIRHEYNKRTDTKTEGKD